MVSYLKYYWRRGTYRRRSSSGEAIEAGVRIIGIEAAGCPMMWTCRQQQQIVKLENVKTAVPILAARSTEALNFALIEQYIDEIVLVPEALIAVSPREVWSYTGLGIELGAATAVTAVTQQLFAIRPGEKIAVVLCGSGTDGV